METKTVSSKAPGQGALMLDEGALEQARKNLDQGAVTPSFGPWRDDIVRLLNGALATEWVCVLRYRRHHVTAKGIESGPVADEFLIHSNEELAHADRIAQRIVQLGGSPMLDPDQLTALSHASYDESVTLQAMVKSNLQAERVAVESYRQMIALVADKDPTTRQMLESILSQEEEHADELSDLLG